VQAVAIPLPKSGNVPCDVPPIVHKLTQSDEWGQKAKRRKTTGTGSMRYLRTVARRFKNGFRTFNWKCDGRGIETGTTVKVRVEAAATES
jgi:hypothetical protein